jgi:hypothetical protein
MPPLLAPPPLPVRDPFIFLFVLVSHSFLGDMEQRLVLSCAWRNHTKAHLYIRRMSHSLLPSVYPPKGLLLNISCCSCNKLPYTSLQYCYFWGYRATRRALCATACPEVSVKFRECVVWSIPLYFGGCRFESWHRVLSLRQIIGLYINPLKPSGYFVWHRLTIKKFVLFPHSVFVCCVWISRNSD